jgi:uncharacterized HAD superfamily protein
MSQGLRFNEGKNKLSLVPTSLIEGVGQVMTFGASKYEPRNWEKGMSWSKVIDSLDRHILAFKSGEDYDKESNLLHLNHAACNIAFLIEFYKTHPELDDRQQWFKKPFKKVYLDIDGVLADFEKSFLEYLSLPNYEATDWNDYRFRDNFNKILTDETFWLNIEPLIKPEELIYPIKGYVTARPIPSEITSKWLEKNGFPKAEIITVGVDKSKVDFLKENADIFIDDSIQNFVDCQSNGILCYLMSRPHNIKYDVGYYRCNNIKEFFNKIK